MSPESIHCWSQGTSLTADGGSEPQTLAGSQSASPTPRLPGHRGVPHLTLPSPPFPFHPFNHPPLLSARLPSLGSGRPGPVAFSSLFGAAFLFPASNPPKMLSLSPSTDYKQTLTSCFSESWRRHKDPLLPVHPLLAKNCSAFGVFCLWGFFFSSPASQVPLPFPAVDCCLFAFFFFFFTVGCVNAFLSPCCRAAPLVLSLTLFLSAFN